MNATTRTQGDLFSIPADDGDGWKPVDADDARKYRYRELPTGILEIDLQNGSAPLTATVQGNGGKGKPRYWFDHPEIGLVQRRSLGGFFAKLVPLLRAWEALQLSIEKTKEALAAQEFAAQQATSVIASAIQSGETQKPRTRNTLCRKMEPMPYEARRVVPMAMISQSAKERWTRASFWMLPAWIAERQEMTLGEKMVYSRMAFHAGQSGVALPSEDTLAEEIGLTRRQVNTIIQSLKNRRMLREVKRGIRGVIHHEFLWHPWITEWEERNRRTCELTSQVDVNLVPPTCELTAHKKNPEKKTKNPESDRQREGEARSVPARANDSGFRCDATKGDSGRFARDANAVPHDLLWETLCRTLGLLEMKQNGALWLTRYKLCRDALATAVSDFNAMTEANRAKWNAAAYITTAFENEKRRMSL